MNYYHVITQSYGEKNIFQDEDDCLYYLQAVIVACQKYNIAWLAYAVMPTHTHLLWRGDLENIRKARRKISCRYAVYVRKKYPELFHVKKQVFRDKNQIKWLQTSYDVKNEIRYLHFNPIKKDLEPSLGTSIRSSFGAALSFWEPNDMQNPFNRFFELQEIRDFLALSLLAKFFGNNNNAQKQSFLSFHQENFITNFENRLKVADNIVQEYFCKSRYYGRKPFDTKNREAFLLSLNRRNNPLKYSLISRISQDAHLSTREIADFLHIGQSTVKDILRKSK